MFIPNRSMSEIPSDVWNRIERLIVRFEKALSRFRRNALPLRTIFKNKVSIHVFFLSN